MPIHQVIVYTKHVAHFTRDAAVAGRRCNVPDAADAAMRAVEAACVAYTHAHADLMLTEPMVAVDQTALRLCDLATDAARAARVAAMSSTGNDLGLAHKAASQAQEAADAAQTAADAAEADVTDPGSVLGREAAKQVMAQAAVEAGVETDSELSSLTEALRSTHR